MDLEDIAGYSLRRKLGSGSAGDDSNAVWQVRDLASGRNAVLKRVPITAIPDQEKLREDLAILQRLRHPHVARLLELRETGTEWLLISQYVVAGSLAALLRRRDPLSPGELVTLLTPLAEALDHLHRSGLTHGRLTPANTLFDADGRPVLTDVAVHLLGATGPPYGPTEDLLALAALAHQAGGDPSVFTPDLFTTTPPHDLPSRLLTLAAPAPIDLAFPQDAATDTTPSRPPRPAPDDPIERSRGPLNPPPPKPPSSPTPQATTPHPPAPAKLPKRTRRTRGSRRPNLTRRTPAPINPLARLTLRLPRPAYGVLAAAGLGAVVVLVLGIATVGALDTPTTSDAATSQPTSDTAQTTPSTPTPAATTLTPTATGSRTEATNWAVTLKALDAQRAHAFWTLDLDALDNIYVPGSQPWLADRALLAAYRKQKVRVQGLRIQIDKTTIAHQTPTTVTLKTTDHLTAGQAVDHAGTRTPLPPGTPTTRLITLTKAPTHRITTITLA